MKILIEGENESDYLAKRHEAFRDGLRLRFDVRSFGKGYAQPVPSDSQRVGFIPIFRRYREIMDYAFPDSPPDQI